MTLFDCIQLEEDGNAVELQQAERLIEDYMTYYNEELVFGSAD